MYKRRKRFPKGIFSCIIVFSFILLGFYIGYNKIKMHKTRVTPFPPDDNVKISDKINPDDNLLIEEDDEIAVNYFADTINQDTEIMYKTLYDESNHVLEEELIPSSEFIGFREKDLEIYLKNNFPAFMIESFSSEKVVLYQYKNKTFSNDSDFYLVTEKDGYITIYYMDANGGKELIEITSIPISILPHVDQNKLREGIYRKTKKEVYELLEDYNS